MDVEIARTEKFQEEEMIYSKEIALELLDKVLPAKERIKIGTLRLAERFRGQRLGEGALGVALWRWQEQEVEEI